MNDKYLFLKNISKFEPQKKNPKGETHEDWAFFSFDTNRKKYIIREFNIEGFVNTYVLDTLAQDAERFVFVSEQSENAPSGLKAKLTYQIKSDNEFEEIFELAMAGNNFTEWLRNYWTRQ
jgi:hypothetical protein